MLEFIRPDLADFVAYTPHPGGVEAALAGIMPLDQLDTNENPYDLPDDLKSILGSTYQHDMSANRYPEGSHVALKQAIAAYVNETATLLLKRASSSTIKTTPGLGDITPEHLSVGNGSDELIRSLLIATCLHQGAILVAEPTFSMYGIEAKGLGIPVVTVPRSPETFAIDLEAAQAALQQHQSPPIRALFMVHPNSPTGNALTDAELTWLHSIPSHILVVIDEAYFEFSQQTLVQCLAQRPNWAILRTFSKAFRLAAHRIGYAIAHPELITALERIRLPYNLPATTQVAAMLALTHRERLLAVIPTLLAERDRLFHGLSQCPELQVWPSDANFLFVRTRSSLTDLTVADIQHKLKAMGTLVRHTGEGLRITVGTPDENARTLERLYTVLGRKNPNFSERHAVQDTL